MNKYSSNLHLFSIKHSFTHLALTGEHNEDPIKVFSTELYE